MTKKLFYKSLKHFKYHKEKYCLSFFIFDVSKSLPNTTLWRDFYLLAVIFLHSTKYDSINFPLGVIKLINLLYLYAPLLLLLRSQLTFLLSLHLEQCFVKIDKTIPYNSTYNSTSSACSNSR